MEEARNSLEVSKTDLVFKHLASIFPSSGHLSRSHSPRLLQDGKRGFPMHLVNLSVPWSVIHMGRKTTGVFEYPEDHVEFVHLKISVLGHLGGSDD